jgi:hypothetical protein
MPNSTVQDAELTLEALREEVEALRADAGAAAQKRVADRGRAASRRVEALLAELLPLPDSVDESAATPAALSRAGSSVSATPRTSAPKPLAPKAAALAAQMHQTPYNNSSRRITRR